MAQTSGRSRSVDRGCRRYTAFGGIAPDKASPQDCTRAPPKTRTKAATGGLLFPRASLFQPRRARVADLIPKSVLDLIESEWRSAREVQASARLLANAPPDDMPVSESAMLLETLTIPPLSPIQLPLRE